MYLSLESDGRDLELEQRLHQSSQLLDGNTRIEDYLVLDLCVKDTAYDTRSRHCIALAPTAHYVVDLVRLFTEETDQLVLRLRSLSKAVDCR